MIWLSTAFGLLKSTIYFFLFISLYINTFLKILLLEILDMFLNVLSLACTNSYVQVINDTFFFNVIIFKSCPDCTEALKQQTAAGIAVYFM
jgi:hypothetical protein